MSLSFNHLSGLQLSLRSRETLTTLFPSLKVMVSAEGEGFVSIDQGDMRNMQYAKFVNRPQTVVR